MTFSCISSKEPSASCVEPADLNMQVALDAQGDLQATSDQVRIQFGTVTAQPARLCYSPVLSAQGGYDYTSPELSSNFGDPGNEHKQWIPIDPDFAGEDYSVIVQVLDDDANWVDLSCPFTFPTQASGCTPSPLHDSLGFSNRTANSVEVDFTFTQNAPGRLCYAPLTDPSALQYTPAELSSNFGAPLNPHTQTLTGLTSSTAYLVNSQTTTDGGLTWTDVSCPEQVNTTGVILTPTTRAADIGADVLEPFLTDGYTVKWSNTPIGEDVGKRLKDYLPEPHWSNGYPMWRNSQGEFNAAGYDNVEQNRIVLDPLEGMPAMRSRVVNYLQTNPRETNIFEGLNVRGNQFGPQGCPDRSIIYTGEFMTTDDEFGVIHPDPTNNSQLGMYIGLGHFPFTRPGIGQDGFSGGGQFIEGTATARVPIQNDTRFFNFFYLEQRKNQTPPRFSLMLNNTAPSFNDLRGRWNRFTLKVDLNSAPRVRDGDTRLWINEVFVGRGSDLFANADGFEIVGYMDQLAKGWGMLHSHYRSTSPGGEERLYFRNQAILTRANP